MSLIFYILAFLLAISLLVAIHEYGHYIVARWCGIKVLRFSVGFGKPIFARRWGRDQTEYCVSSLPLGGYVRMLDEREGEIAPADVTRTFQAQPVWQRIAVLLAGPMANFLFVIFAFWVLFMIGIPTQRAVIGQIISDSPAELAGVQEGDTIVSVDGQPVAGWEPAFIAIIEDIVGDGTVTLGVTSIDDPATREVSIRVDESLARLEEPGELLSGIGFSRWRVPSLIGDVVEGSAAASAGLQAGDRITALDGQPVKAFIDINTVMAAMSDTREMTVGYTRRGEQRTVRLTPQKSGEGDEQRFLLGIYADTATVEAMRGTYRLGPLAAIPAAVKRLFTETGFTLRMLGRMVSGDVSAKNLSGPVSIAQFAGEAAERGLSDYIRFLAVISISLGVLNLLPIPMLDGGQIVYQTIEGITGSPVSERTQLVGQQFGIFVLLSVMVFAFYNDLARLFG